MPQLDKSRYKEYMGIFNWKLFCVKKERKVIFPFFLYSLYIASLFYLFSVPANPTDKRVSNFKNEFYLVKNEFYLVATRY